MNNLINNCSYNNFHFDHVEIIIKCIQYDEEIRNKTLDETIRGLAKIF